MYTGRRYQKFAISVIVVLIGGIFIFKFSILTAGDRSVFAKSSVWKVGKEQAELANGTLVSQSELSVFDINKLDLTTEDEKEVSKWTEDEDDEYAWRPKHFDYREVFSLSTRDRKFSQIFWNGGKAYNPNIIPHPTKSDMYIIVAQHEQYDEDFDVSEELSCIAGYMNGVLVCSAKPTALPIERYILGQCADDLAYVNLRGGPRDARMFYGPDAPYIMYGSQSGYTCLGLWLQDVRMLLDAFRLDRYILVKLFKKTTEIKRVAPWKPVEKNYFVFWDAAGRSYAHYDLWPARSYAQLEIDGSASGNDLATAASASDQICMAKFMPTVGTSQESIHQATNTLSITMCRRADKSCKPTDDNTFVMHIFHHKTYYDYHGVYEPFVILFKRNSPFEIHAISQRPFWIHGRAKLTQFSASIQYRNREDSIPEGHTEMFYITSMSWKTHGQRYHGYIDDPMFVAFGIEDTRSGIIDITAGDILQDLAFC